MCLLMVPSCWCLKRYKERMIHLKITSVSGSAYEDNKGEVSILRVHLEKGEIIRRNEMISIEMMDDSFLEREVKIIDPKYAGDFYLVSKKMETEVKAGKTKYSDKLKEYVEGECNCTIVVKNVPCHEVKTDDEINARKLRAERERRFNLSLRLIFIKYLRRNFVSAKHFFSCHCSSSPAFLY